MAMSFAAVAMSGGALGQQAAGRFLIAVGTVSVERGAERIAAAAGAEVRAGDTIQVGPQSNAQIRLADASIIALRPETTFRISTFNFGSPGQQKDSAFFSLLKGGIRTVTGLIGKTNQQDYAVETPTATIGIRGTHYTLRVCNDDCVETTTTAQAPIHLAAAQSPASDAGPLAQLAQSGTPVPGQGGTRVPNGTYGAVADGRISVTNQSGAREFGADQYFRVASRTSPPQQLIGPPSFLRDRLEGRGRGSRQQRTSGQQQSSPGGAQQGGASQSSGSGTPASAPSSGSETAVTVALTGQGAGTGDTGVSSAVSTPVISVPISPTLTQVTNQVSTSGPTTLLQATGASQVNFYRLAGPVSIPAQCSPGPCGTIVLADFIMGVNPTTQRARYTLFFQGSDGSMYTLSSAFRGDIPVSVSGSQLVFSSTDNSADYPFSGGSFRCSDCGPGNTTGPLLTVGVSGTISGGQIALTLTLTDAPGSSGSVTTTLPLATPPNNLSAALAGPFTGVMNGGAQWSVQVNGAGQPVYVGEPLGIGVVNAVGPATIQTIGANAAAGNLSWGTWTGASTGAGSDFQPFTLASNAVVPWIIGSIPNSIPASLGTSVSYTPVGWLVGNGFGAAGTLNSATLNANFVNRNIALNINAANGAGGTYQLNGSAPFSSINGRFISGFSSASCTGTCGAGAVFGGFIGFLSGPNAEGAGVSFGAANATAGVAGVIGFKR
jgi:hypothetical protein